MKKLLIAFLLFIPFILYSQDTIKIDSIGKTDTVIQMEQPIKVEVICKHESNNNFWNIDLSTIIGIVSGFLLFFAGLFVSWFSKKRAIQFKSNTFKEFVIYWFIDSKKLLFEQKKSNSEFINEILNTDEFSTKSLNYVSFNANKILEIPANSFFENIATMQKGNGLNMGEFNNYFYKAINDVHHFEKELLMDYQNYRSQVHELIEEWNNHYRLLRNAVQTTRHSKTVFGAEVNTLFISVFGEGKNIPNTNIVNDYIKPLMLIGVKYHTEFPKSDTAKQLSIACDNLLGIQHRYIETCKTHTIRFKDTQQKIDELGNKLNNCIVTLKRVKVKKFLLFI